MPIYSYECDDCGRAWDEARSVDARHDMRCPTCGAIPSLVITGSPACHIMKPFFSTSLGIHVKSRRELDQYCKANDIIDVTGMDVEDVNKIARGAKAHRDKVNDKIEFETKFMPAWKKAEAEHPVAVDNHGD